MTMKYMIGMFGEAAGMMETEPPAWIKEMIGFMATPPRARPTSQL